MSLEGLLRLLSAALQEAGIPFMLSGSVAAGYRGASRATMNVDDVIDPTALPLHAFIRRILDAGLYVSDDAARDALAASPWTFSAFHSQWRRLTTLSSPYSSGRHSAPRHGK